MNKKHWDSASAKARLTSVAIRIQIRIPDPDRHQNLIICSLVNVL